MILAVLAAVNLTTAAPSFDCARAAGVERVICAEPRLAELDVRLAGRFSEALRAAPADAAATRQGQRDWLRMRNLACGKAAAVAPCLDGFYLNRLADLSREARRREETAGHAPASGAYADFVGRWRVVGVTAAEDAGEATEFTTDDPSYMGLQLSARPGELRWLNGASETGTTDICRAPAFVGRKAGAALPAGCLSVTLTCGGQGAWTEPPVTLTLKARDLAEMEWADGALLRLTREAEDARVLPPPHRGPPPPLPPDNDARLAAGDRKFLLDLQSAVRRGDRHWLAATGGVRVNRVAGASHDYTPEEILKDYDWIITPQIRRAILAQRPDGLFRNAHGAMVGNGEVWFDAAWTGGRWVYLIIAVNQGG